MNDRNQTPVTEDVIRKAAKSTLDDSTALLDDDVRQRLQQARRVAIQAATVANQRPSRSAIRPGWMVAGGFAGLALVISVVLYTFPISQPSPMASIEDMPILTAPEDLELYEELDFFQWLAEEHDSVG
jgi:hypothetical protein